MGSLKSKKCSMCDNDIKTRCYSNIISYCCYSQNEDEIPKPSSNFYKVCSNKCLSKKLNLKYNNELSLSSFSLVHDPPTGRSERIRGLNYT